MKSLRLTWKGRDKRQVPLISFMQTLSVYPAPLRRVCGPVCVSQENLPQLLSLLNSRIRTNNAVVEYIDLCPEDNPTLSACRVMVVTVPFKLPI